MPLGSYKIDNSVGLFHSEVQSVICGGVSIVSLREKITFEKNLLRHIPEIKNCIPHPASSRQDPDPKGRRKGSAPP